ncbi:CBS domain-containing protein [Catelliglobosispora koreensis]|uniref:CBS domain-containing protein n=1 Tax=Catelliglobosispora koreensis TaxID=129052 RepID=UPI000381A23C|nr:CBS domain-containing protein [Catelliglobosispora koreensis]
MKRWTVADVMTTGAISVGEDTPYQEIVNRLAIHHVSAVPVVDSVGKVVGVVSEADLLRKVEFTGENTEPKTFEWGTKKVSRAKAHAATAHDLMSTPAITIQTDVPVVRAAQEMAQHNVKRLPVVDYLGRLTGIVSRADLLKVYLRSDTDIRDDIVDGVLRRILWLDPIGIQVDVADGVVTLNGRVERKSSAELVVHITKTVPGVTKVDGKLAWDVDDTIVTATTGL